MLGDRIVNRPHPHCRVLQPRNNRSESLSLMPHLVQPLSPQPRSCRTNRPLLSDAIVTLPALLCSSLVPMKPILLSKTFLLLPPLGKLAGLRHRELPQTTGC